MTRILAVVTGGENRAKARQLGDLSNRQRPRGPRKMEQQKLDKNQCAYCKEKGHWAKECPKRAGTRVLSLEDDDKD